MHRLPPELVALAPWIAAEYRCDTGAGAHADAAAEGCSARVPAVRSGGAAPADDERLTDTQRRCSTLPRAPARHRRVARLEGRGLVAIGAGAVRRVPSTSSWARRGAARSRRR